MNEMSVADVLEQAADALFIYGRAAGQGQRDTGEMCVLGAMEFVQGLRPFGLCYWGPGRDEMDAYVGTSTWCWNDKLPVTPENDALVIDTLKRCAKELRAAEAVL